MKSLGLLVALAAFPIASFGQAPDQAGQKPIGAVILRPLTPSKGDGDFSALVASAGAATLNLDDILLVLDSPEKYDPSDVVEAKKYLTSASAQAKDLIAKADVALARTDLPRTVQNPSVYFPRISMIVDGTPGANERELASARAEVLACQATLLNMRMAAKDYPDTASHQATFEKYLADSRAELQKAEAAAAK